MTQRIIYATTDGGVAVVIPAQEAIDKYGITAIAQKDVPAGVQYKIVEDSDLPVDRTFRNAWELSSETVFDGQGIGQASWFEEQKNQMGGEANDSNQPE